MALKENSLLLPRNFFCRHPSISETAIFLYMILEDRRPAEMNLRREIKEGGGSKHMPLVAVAIDKDKGSQNALKWALDKLVTSKGETITLVHVNTRKAGSPPSEDDSSIRDIFYPFRVLCKRKDVICNTIIIDDTNIAKAIAEFISQAAIGEIVLGESSRFFRRLKMADVPAKVLRSAPNFCTVYEISTKGKLLIYRKAMREAPLISPLRTLIEKHTRMNQEAEEYQIVMNALRGEYARETRFELPFSPLNWLSFELPLSQQSLMGDDSETEMGRHRLKVKQMMEMYNTACKETLDAKKQIVEFRQLMKEEESRLWKAKQAQEAALEMVEKECSKCRVAIVAAYKNMISM